MSKMMLFMSVVLVIESELGEQEFNLRLKKLTKKDDKKFKKWAKEQEEKFSDLKELSDKALKEQKKLEYLSEEIDDLSDLISVTKEADSKKELLQEKIELRKKYKSLSRTVDTLNKNIADREDEFNKVKEELGKKLFELKVVENEDSLKLMSYIEELGLDYNEIIAELGRLEREARKKK